jgi:hypothetical protein
VHVITSSARASFAKRSTVALTAAGSPTAVYVVMASMLCPAGESRIARASSSLRSSPRPRRIFTRDSFTCSSCASASARRSAASTFRPAIT